MLRGAASNMCQAWLHHVGVSCNCCSKLLSGGKFVNPDGSSVQAWHCNGDCMPCFVGGNAYMQQQEVCVCNELNTWLILPVVICLSQRLSHACPRLSFSWRICEWLIKPVIILLVAILNMDNCGNSTANTWLHAQLSGRVVLISSRTIPGFAKCFGDTW